MSTNWTNKGKKWEALSGRTYRVRQADDGAWIAEFRGVKVSWWLVLSRHSSQEAAQDACEQHNAARWPTVPLLVKTAILAVFVALTGCGPDPYTTYGHDASGIPSPDSSVNNNFNSNGNNNNLQPGVCGDGVVNLGEQCDDGNHDTTDWCPDGPFGTCQFSSCGDGYVQAGMEDCDDGNGINEDLCPDGEYGTCRLAECGDGHVFLGVEDCEPGLDPYCHTDCAGRCGDGIIRPGWEVCDDYNTDTDDGCSNSCELEEGWDCTVGSPTVCTAICGDGLVVGNEECDGDNLNGETCFSAGFDGGPLFCVDCSTFDTDRCFTCGDGECQDDDGEHIGNCPADCGIGTIDAGNDHTCAVRNDGTVWCWGDNEWGQLGINTGDDTNPLPVQVPIEDVVHITAGGDRTCVLKNDGSVWCWGYNFLGDGSHGGSFVPVLVANLTNVVDVSAAYNHTCAVQADGTVWCWGYEGEKLGGDYGATQDVPAQVVGLAGMDMVTANQSHTCAAANNDVLWCWGNNGSGQLGTNGSPISSYTPLQVHFLTSVSKVIAGAVNTCASQSGDLWCWGVNGFGQVGDGTTINRSTPVPGILSNTQNLDSGFMHSCAVKTDGTVWCWGYNSQGQLGDGTTTQRESPTQVNSLTNAMRITTGNDHTCAVKNDGVVWCWGYNSQGQLGDGTITGPSLTPVQVQF